MSISRAEATRRLVANRERRAELALELTAEWDKMIATIESGVEAGASVLQLCEAAGITRQRYYEAKQGHRRSRYVHTA